MTRYQVTAALATVRTASVYNPLAQGGLTVIHLPQGAILPADVEEAQIKHLLDGRIIEPVDGPNST